MILLTGSTGFLGKLILNTLGTNNTVKTIGRSGNDIELNLSAGKICKLPVSDIVIHCAGKAHMVPKSKAEVQMFYDVNVNGTRNLLSSLECSNALPKCFVFISTVAVYGVDSGTNINEDAPLLAQDPYGLSKIQAEQLVIDWCQQNNVIYTILRLPLLAGPTPPGNLGAMINGIKKGYYFNIAGGNAKKSMVLASDVVKVIPYAATIGGIYNLTDGYNPSLKEMGILIARQLSMPKPKNIPYFFGQLMAYLGDVIGKRSPINSNKFKKLTSDLTFDDSKARQILGWNPTPVLQGFKIY